MFDEHELPLLGHTFDFGTTRSTEPVNLPEDELTDYGFFSPNEAVQRLAPYDVPRFTAGLAARVSGRTAYLSDGDSPVEVSRRFRYACSAPVS
jgi:hypothetical protein